MSRKGSGRKRSRYGAEMATFMLTLERPSPEELSDYGRSEKYSALKANTSQVRDQLLEWIREQGLAEGVARVGEPTAFNTLFITSTRLVAEELIRAPGVVAVRQAEEFRVNLLPDLREAPADTAAPASGEEPG